MSTQEAVDPQAAGRLLRQVAGRQAVARLGSRFHLFVLALAGVYCAVFVASRLLGLIPDWFDPLTLLVLPAGALVLGAILHRRTSDAEAARLVDTRADTKDLFLTAALLDSAPGDYKPIVLEQARQRAATIQPKKVVPYRWETQGRNIVIAVGVLLLGVLFLPQLDPFGKGEARKKNEERRRELAKSRKAAALRAKLLKKSDPAAKHSKQAQLAIDELKKTFKRMKPRDRKGNLERLTAVQKPLSEIWRKRDRQRLKEAFSRRQNAQRLGGAKGQQAEKWKRRLKRGDASELKKEIEKLKEQARQIEQLSNAAEKQKLRQDLQQRLKDMANFMANNASSKSMQEACKRALEQLATSENKQLSKEAMKALKESLDLAELEADALAQAIRDLEALEQALKVSQLAKQLNQLRALDGKACDGCQGMGDYEEFYKKLMEEAGKVAGAGNGEEAGEGDGGGMGGPGRGRGGEAPEDPAATTDFQTERSRSAFKAGKILLQWKTSEVSPPGTARENYRRHIKAVKDGVTEAILQERVPPGYREGIKKYFDSLGKEPDKKP